MINANSHNILVVDDEESVLISLRDYISDLGYNVTTASSGFDAIALFDKNNFDLIVLDLSMPNISGIDVIKHVNSSVFPIPTIVVSAVGDISKIVSVLNEGAWDFIIKPINDMAILGHAIEKNLEKFILIKENKRYREFLEDEVIARTIDLTEKTKQLEKINQELLKEIETRKAIEQDLKKLNREMAEKELKLLESNASKDKLFSIISHDLVSPFTTILGNVELLKEGIYADDKEEEKRLIETIYKSSKRAYKLVEDLLLWSRSQIDTIGVHFEEIKVKPIVENILELFSSQISNKNLNVKFECNDDIVAYCDRNMLNNIIRNILSNAIKFSIKYGNISINVLLSKEKDNVIFLIKDNGVGMSEEEIKTLIAADKYFSKRGTAGEKGNGMGLMLTFDFIKKNRGIYNIQSSPGIGTTFSFTIPTKNNNSIKQ